ncbi:MAG: prepilin-type N-terminal cleavage/methylation domain-containing protein [Patescibacteria group bacterium]
MKRGFTLTEILIVMALLGFITTLGVGIGIDTYRRQIFSSQVDALVSFLHAARNQAMNNLHQSEHTVRIDDDAFVLLYGSVETPVARSESVEVSGLDEVTFEQLSGETDDDGEIELTNGIRTAHIEISTNGRIEWSYE